ncbi:MAG: BatA domain-containing protein [Pedobacter sp.]|nr:BatA domain-containing protein [Pedobacter sp.]
MNFLYPGFLFALLTIAIPIVIHLFNFRKFKKVYFSNVQFLKEAKEQNSTREKLKHLLVLFSRILAIIFLVLAFARPFFPSGKTVNPSQRNVVSIYIDNSYSMETVNKEGSLLDEAKRKAKEIVGSYELSDQFQLLTNDFEGRHQRFMNKDQFVQQLEEVKVSSTSRSLQQVINRQQSGANNNDIICYLLSDFQKNFSGTLPIRADSSSRLTFIKLNANSLPNISVDSIWSLSPIHQPNQSEQIVVRLKNFGEEDAKDVTIKLSLNGQQKAIRNVAVPAGKSITDTLSFSGLNAGWQKGILTIKDYPLTFDDELNFSFNVNAEMNVLHIYGNPSQSYIKSLFAADSYFKLTEMPEGNVKYSTFSGYSLIVVTGLKEPSSGLAQQLKSYVQNGGSLIVFPDLNAGSAHYSPFLTGLSLPKVGQINAGTPVTSTLDLKNELFKNVFDQIPKNLDLPTVSRYFSYVSQNTSSREDVLQLPLNNFLLAKYIVGAGKIYLSASSLDPNDGNLARHPVFVPIMFKIAFGSARTFPLYYTTGTSDVLEIKKINLLKNQSLKLVSDQFEAIPDLRQTPASTLLYVADQIKKSGFYNLEKGDSTLAVMAFIDNRIESDMHYASNVELSNLLGKQKVNIFNSRKDAQSLQVTAKSNSTELWKLCVILALVFLAIEILLIRFFNNTKNLKTA